jgi:6-phosphogluconolactonase
VLILSCSTNKPTENIEASGEGTLIDLLVGTYTGEGSEGIYHVSFNSETGELTNQNLMASTKNPSYMAISSDRKFVYCVNESDSGKVSSFSWDHSTNKLNQLSQQSSEGSYPCYIDINDDENILALANYMTGNLVTYTINKEGIIQGSPVVYQHKGSGPNTSRQEGPHAHCAVFNPTNNFLYCVDLGIDQIVKYPVLGNQIIEGSTAITIKGGNGPRHLAFHPNKNLAFVVNELSNSVVSMKTDNELGAFEMINEVSALPEGYSETSYCADIHTSDDGKFLYVSNRGHNSIAIFSIAEDGSLTQLATESTGGEWPRNFTLSPNGDFLLVANQNTHNVVSLKVDKATGLLTKTGYEISISKPVCLKF